eukprot:CAMPEP_0170590060 /NCGR_PEP_ID=MMETSP0224-20130122/11668_1 /TAXON_ID=285029 /ORGANISM="Togula jolla, Strain CCCM 725" /LENGTH=238 /DNA_ID=CAMNT_0010913831 /DNA_START=55 /DNA_END=771 /DNA_ORIENTATION=+
MMAGVTTVNNKQGLFQKLTQPFPEHTGIFKLHMQASATMGTAEVREAVKLPPYVQEDEWIVAKTLGIYEEVTHVVSLMEDLCGECKLMNAGKCITYAWANADGSQSRKVTAKEYMRNLLDFANEVLSDRELIPLDGRDFPDPEAFRKTIKVVLKRTFRVYAHAYIVHFQKIRDLDVEGQMNYCFKHFLFFVREFDLVTEKEMEPLMDLIRKFEGEPIKVPEENPAMKIAQKLADMAVM